MRNQWIGSWLGCWLLTLCAGLACAAAQPPVLSVSPAPEGPTVGYDIHLEIQGLERGTETLLNEVYDTIMLPGWQNTREPGKPSLPGKTLTFEIPPNAKPVVTVSAQSVSWLNTVKLAPVQPVGPNGVPVIDADLFASSAPYPSNTLTFSGTTWARNHKLLAIGLAPVQYRPAAQALSFATSLDISIRFDEDPDARLPLDGNLAAMASPIYDQAAGAGIHGFNYFGAPDDYVPKYLILCNDEFATNAALQAFIAWKEQKGLDVTVLKTSEIPDMVEAWGAGYDWVNSELYYDLTYDLFSGQMGYLYSMPAEDYPDYMLFIGDAAQTNGIPGRVTDWSVAAWYRTYSDAILANHTMYDTIFYCIPDCFYGRLPATNNLELTTMLERAIEMDRNPPDAGDDFYQHAVLGGLCDRFNSSTRMYYRNLETVDGLANYLRWTTNTDYTVDNIWVDDGFYASSSDTLWSSYSLFWQGATGEVAKIGERISTQLLTTAEDDGLFAGRINAGTAMAIHFGREANGRDYSITANSGVRTLHDPELTRNEVWALTNGHLRPLFVSLSGDVGGYHFTNTLIRAMLTSPGGGAYAAIAGVGRENTWWNSFTLNGMFQGLMGDYRPYYFVSTDPDYLNGPFRPVEDRREGAATRLGEMLHYGKMRAHEVAPGYWGFKEIVEGMQLYGDPESPVLFRTPVPFAANHPARVPAGVRTIAVSGLGEDAAACLYSEEAGIKELRKSVNDTATFHLTLAGTGTLHVTATAFGRRPYEGVIHYGDPSIQVVLPDHAVESDGTLAGQGLVTVEAAPAQRLLVELTSSDTTELHVPEFVWIEAGATSTTFNLYVLNDGYLDGQHTVTVTPAADAHHALPGTIDIWDAQTCSIAMTLPTALGEGQGTVTGRVDLSVMALADVEVTMANSNTNELTVPPTVLVRAGETSGLFAVTVIDDIYVDRTQTAVVETAVGNWVNATSVVTIADNEILDIDLSLPADFWENDGILYGAGRVAVSGYSTSNLTVNLSVSGVTQLDLPATVTIPVGATGEYFDIEVGIDGLRLGIQTAVVQAAVSGFTTAQRNCTMHDGDVSTYAITFATNLWRAGVTNSHLQILARNAADETILTFTNKAWFSALSTNGNTIAPTSSGSFAYGIWTGKVGAAYTENGLRMRAYDGNGRAGTSAPVYIVSPFVSYDLDTQPAGWTMDVNWQYGTPQGPNTCTQWYGTAGCPDEDPSAGYTGTKIFGYDLTGDRMYEHGMSPKYLKTAALDFTGKQDVRLCFYRKLLIDSFDADASIDRAAIEVSTNGTTWTTVWENGRTCVWDQYGQWYCVNNAYDLHWSYREYALPAWVDGKANVQIRWVMGPTDGDHNGAGWNLDDIALIANPAGGQPNGMTQLDGLTDPAPVTETPGAPVPQASPGDPAAPPPSLTDGSGGPLWIAPTGLTLAVQQKADSNVVLTVGNSNVSESVDFFLKGREVSRSAALDAVAAPSGPGVSVIADGLQDGASGASGFGFNAMKPPANTISIEYTFPEPVVTRGVEYDDVSMPGLAAYRRIGEPVVPLRAGTVLLPQGKRIVSVQVTPLDTATLPGVYRLRPATPPQPLSRMPATPSAPEPDPSVYALDTPWPGTLYQLVDTQDKRGYQLASINLLPLQYTPATGAIAWYPRLRLDVTIEDDPSVAQSAHRASATVREDLAAEVDNPTVLAAYTEQAVALDSPLAALQGVSPGSYKFVIVSDANLMAAPEPWNLQALRDNKLARGISATIVSTEWIYANYDGTRPSGGTDEQTKIRQFIRDAYVTWGTENVLLAGGHPRLPARHFYVLAYEDGEEDEMPVDLYYACLDTDCSFDEDADGVYGEPTDGAGGGEVDLRAEVSVGRAPLQSQADVANWVRKTLTYAAESDSYLGHSHFMGEHLGFGGVSEYADGMMEQIRGGGTFDGYFTYGFTNHIRQDLMPLDTHTLYDTTTWEYSKQDVIDLINADNRHLLNHLGHCNQYYWSRITTTDGLPSLTNNHPFFIYTQGCMPGWFDNDEGIANCFAEEITTMSNGAFAVIMNVRYGWGTQNSTDGPSQRYHRRFWDAVLRTNDIHMSLGRANHDSKERNIYALTAGYNGGEEPCMRWVMYEATLFGDPEQEFKIVDACPWMILPTNQMTLAAGATTNLDVTLTAEALQPGEYRGLVLAQPTSAALAPANAAVTLTVLPDKLQVTPSDAFLSGGPYGGAFSVTSVVYTITNSGAEVAWSAVWPGAQDWFTSVPSGGTLASGATVEVMVCLTAEAYTLKPGIYETMIGFSNQASRVTADRIVKLVVEDPLTVDPATTQLSTGMEGGPFAPTTMVYSVTNKGLATLNLALVADRAWLSLSPTALTIGPSGMGVFTAVVNEAAASLGATNETVHTAWIAVSNAQTAIVTARRVDLRVTEIPYLSFPLDSDPGWMRSGEWAFGAPGGSGGSSNAPACDDNPWWGASCGHQDPAAAYSGANVFGIELAGNYATDSKNASYLVAGPIDLAGNARTRVAFRRYLNQDVMPYVYAAFQISRDGLNWQDVWTNGSDVVLDDDWTDCMYDIGAFADHSTNLYLRWVHQTRYPQWSQAYSGWNIDDLRIFGDDTAATNGLPWPWRAQDVGEVARLGDAAWQDGAFTVRGAGADLNGAAGVTDGFHYVYIPWTTTNGWISARVTSVQNVNAATKAGLMVRESLTDGTGANAMMLLTPGSGSRFQRRNAAGGAGADTAGPSVSAPYYLKLTRVGRRLTGYVSADGTNWTSVAYADTAMSNAAVYVGMAVGSHVPDQLAAAVFDQVALSEGVPETPAAPTIDPDGASFSNEVAVTIAADDPVADIRYTTDGSTPSAFSDLYTNALTFTETTTLRARVFIEGSLPGEIAVATFTQLSGDAVPPSAPTDLVALYTGDTSIALGWTASTDDHDLAGYKVYLNGVEAIDLDEYATNYNARGLGRYVVYTNTVRAYDWAGNLSDASAAVVVTTRPGVVAAPSLAPPPGFYRDQVYVEMWDTTMGASIRHTFNGGEPTGASALYTNWPVRIDEDGALRAGAFLDGWVDSPVVTNEYVIDRTAPTAPGNLRLRLSSDIALEIAWDAATDDKGVARYTILRDGVTVGSTTNLRYEDIGLQPTTTYAYAVAAIDFADRVGATSATLNASTDAQDFGVDMADGLAMWVKADAGIVQTNDFDEFGNWKTNGVVRWLDQSGHGNDVRDAYPDYGGWFYNRLIPDAINGMPAVRIEGSWMQYPDTLQLGGLTGMTIIAVAQDRDDYGWRSGLGDAHTASLIYWPNQHTMLTLHSNEVAYGFQSPDTTPTHYGRAVVYTNIHRRFQMVTARKSGNTHELFLNGTRVHQAGVSNPSLSDNVRAHGEYEYWIGRGYGSFTADNTGWRGEIAELMVFTNDISEAERELLDNYLDAKYRLSDRPTAATPSIYPAEGVFTSDTVEVTFSSRMGGSFYYTLDDTAPDETSLLYTGTPVSISQDTTVRVVVVAAGYDKSAEASQVFWKQSTLVATPEASPVGGYFTVASTVTLTCATSGAEIRYTLNGSDPMGSSTLYSSPFAITSNSTLKARAFKEGVTSEVATAAFFIGPASGSGLPYPWQQADVGAVTVTGTSTYQNAVFRNIGAGKIDSAGTADSFRYIYQPIVGDGEVIAHVTDIDGENGAARAGVMIRESLAAGSKMGFMATENGDARNSAWRRRVATGGNNTHTSGAIGDRDRWVRIVRSGNTITAYEKETAGGSWMPVGSSETVAMSNQVLVGLVFMSNLQGTLATGVFESVSVIGLSPGVAVPTLSPTGGLFVGAATVTLSCATSGAEIRYTTDGAYPTETSTLYSTPFTLSADATVKARAFKVGLTASGVGQGTFTFSGDPAEEQIWLEAECGIVTGDWVKVTDALASGGTNVNTASDVGSNYSDPGLPGAGHCLLSFWTPTSGTYAIWARVKTPSSGSDSFWVRVDSDEYVMWDCAEYGSWTWEKWADKSLDAGAHTLSFKQREDGAGVDKVHVTRLPAYTPTSTGLGEHGNNDIDADMLPDHWETGHYGHVSTVAPGDDTDGDGMTTLEEYIAGTLPTDELSVLSIIGVESDGTDGAVLNWNPVSDRMYRLYWATNIMSPDWQSLPELSSGAYTDAVSRSEGAVFYRLKVRRP